MREWSHLPNAAHIDAVIASVTAHPTQWGAYTTEGLAAWNVAYGLVKAGASDKRRALAVARNMGLPGTWDFWLDAILALIAYDDCAYLLSMPSAQVRVLAGLGLPAAILLLPAAIAFEQTRNSAQKETPEGVGCID